MKRNITEEEFRNAVSKSYSIAEVLRNLGRCPYGGAGYRFVKQRILEYNIDTSHFSGSLWSKGKKLPHSPRIPIENILVENKFFNTNTLRKRLISEGLKECKCEKCGNTEWNGEIIPLELHHINGNNMDNRLENLQILCPNCHAQTDNYCSKNKNGNEHLKKEKTSEYTDIKKQKEYKKCPICNKEFIPKSDDQIYCSPECYHISTRKNITNEDIIFLLNLFKEHKSFEGVGRYLNITGNAVKKRCKHLGLPIHIKDITELLNSSSNIEDKVNLKI